MHLLHVWLNSIVWLSFCHQKDRRFSTIPMQNGISNHVREWGHGPTCNVCTWVWVWVWVRQSSDALFHITACNALGHHLPLCALRRVVGVASGLLRMAGRWDAMSVAGWVKESFPASLGVNPAHTGARGILASEENEVSMLYWLRYIRNARGADGSPGIHDHLSLTKGKCGARLARTTCNPPAFRSVAALCAGSHFASEASPFPVPHCT